MKILVSAYACSPYQGSEASMGWGFVYELAKHHELTVFVEEEKFRDDIEDYLAKNVDHVRGIKFIYVLKKRNRSLRKIWPPSYFKYYRDWHKTVLSVAQNLDALADFDLVHQLNMSGFREPGYLWKLDIPFVWGPIGGMGYFPAKFLYHIGLKGFCYHLAYNVYNFIHMRFLPRPKIAARKAGDGLISATSENQRFVSRLWSLDSTIIVEIGIPNLVTDIIPVQRSADDPVRFVWSGLHITRKALNLAMSAVAKLPQTLNWELHILGSGELTDEWKGYAERLGIANRCNFHGMLGRSDALDIMMSSHIMLITSLRDLTSAVTIESLTLGIPVVCLDHCGFSDAIDKSCGIKIPVTNMDEVTHRMSDALNLLASNEDLRRDLSMGALERAKLFSWSEKVKVLNEIYDSKAT